MAISSYLNKDLILFLQAKDREDALNQMIDALNAAGKLFDKEAFKRAIFQREKVVSTGIGMGVALPHAKLEGYKDFFLAIGLQKEDGLEWDALDGSRVKLIFMIGGPENQQTEYLKILSKLTMAIKDEERRRKLIKCSTPDEVIALFQGC